MSVGKILQHTIGPRGDREFCFASLCLAKWQTQKERKSLSWCSWLRLRKYIDFESALHCVSIEAFILEERYEEKLRGHRGDLCFRSILCLSWVSTHSKIFYFSRVLYPACQTWLLITYIYLNRSFHCLEFEAKRFPREKHLSFPNLGCFLAKMENKIRKI